MINVNMTDRAGVTLATAGKYCADNVKVTPSAEILRKDEQAKTATPTTSAQDITPDAGKALSKVTVNPITAAIVGNLDASSFAASIVAAVEGKGVDVPSGAKLDALAALIESIEAGSGDGEFFVTSGKITFPSKILLKDNPIVIEHGLPKNPCVFFAACGTPGYYAASALAYACYVTSDFGILRSNQPLIAYAQSAGAGKVSVLSYSGLITADGTNVLISYDGSIAINIGSDSTPGELTWVALARK